MSQRQTLVPYTLKLEGEMWTKIDRNRLSASSYIEKKEVLDKKILNQLNFSVTKLDGHNHQSINKYITERYLCDVGCVLKNRVFIIFC